MVAVASLSFSFLNLVSSSSQVEREKEKQCSSIIQARRKMINLILTYRMRVLSVALISVLVDVL